jgi:hypothetical protein
MGKYNILSKKAEYSLSSMLSMISKKDTTYIKDQKITQQNMVMFPECWDCK